MKFKKIKIIIILIIMFAMISGVNSVNALKIKYHDQNTKNYMSYTDGEKTFTSKGYIYHNGKFHKQVKTKSDLRPYCYNGYNKKCKYYGRTTIGAWWVEGTSSQIKKVSYGSIRVNGKYTTKKVKMGYDERFGGKAKLAYFHPANDVKGNLKGKTITLSVHNKKGKILSSKSFKVKTINKYLWAGE